MFCSTCGRPLTTPGVACPACGAVNVPPPPAPVPLAPPITWNVPAPAAPPAWNAVPPDPAVPPAWNAPSPSLPGFAAPDPNLGPPPPAYYGYGVPVAAVPGSNLVLKIGAIVLVAILVIATLGVIGLAVVKQNDGKVLFSHSAVNGCSVENPITSAQVGSTVYFSANMRDHFNGTDIINFAISQDGVTMGSEPIPATGADFDCVYEQLPAQFTDTPGTYIFEFTNAAGKQEAIGTLTVTP